MKQAFLPVVGRSLTKHSGSKLFLPRVFKNHVERGVGVLHAGSEFARLLNTCPVSGRLFRFGRSLGRYRHDHVFIALRDVALLRKDPSGYQDFPFLFGAHCLELRRYQLPLRDDVRGL